MEQDKKKEDLTLEESFEKLEELSFHSGNRDINTGDVFSDIPGRNEN